MASLLKTYDPSEVFISWSNSNGTNVEMNEGFAPDTFLTISPDAPKFNTRVGIGGKVARMYNSIETATIKITLLQNSNTNKELMTALNLAGVGGGNEDIGSITISDDSGTILVSLMDCYLESIPVFALSKSYGTVEWTFKCVFLLGNDEDPFIR
tara:strand:- start:33490 stop:33951 length:462 start_codon:yes stop_codon:yes gene_type:complete